jgi:diketogulonate reductase-like aldo/keto reductase
MRARQRPLPPWPAGPLLRVLSLALALPSARPAPTSIEIAAGVMMPTVSNGYISGIYSKGKNATQTIAAFRTWIASGGRGIDTAYECKSSLPARRTHRPMVTGRPLSVTASRDDSDRLIALAAADHNQAEIAQAIHQSGVRREDLFITTKIPCTGDSDSALAHVRADLQQLGLTQLDLVIIHGTGAVPPFAPGDPQYSKNCSSLAHIQATYAGLERALEMNLSRAVGVSNFQVPHLSAVLKSAKHGPPSVNQMRQYVGYHTMDESWEYCRRHGITWMAYSPLGPIGHAKPVLVDKTVLQIAHAHNASAAQVAFAWLAQSNASLTTASDNADYDVEDLDIGSVDLTADEMKLLTELHIRPPNRHAY